MRAHELEAFVLAAIDRAQARRGNAVKSWDRLTSPRRRAEVAGVRTKPVGTVVELPAEPAARAILHHVLRRATRRRTNEVAKAWVVAPGVTGHTVAAVRGGRASHAVRAPQIHVEGNAYGSRSAARVATGAGSTNVRRSTGRDTAARVRRAHASRARSASGEHAAARRGIGLRVSSDARECSGFGATGNDENREHEGAHSDQNARSRTPAQGARVTVRIHVRKRRPLPARTKTSTHWSRGT